MTHSLQSATADIGGLIRLPGGDLLRAILNMDRPEGFVRSLPPDDFFRIVKRIGKEDALPVLAAASGEQWQYLLDLETWRRDSLDASKTLVWLECLARANAARLAEWLFSEQGDLVSLILLRRAHVLFRDEEGQWDVPSGYVSLDGAFYIKAADPVEAQLLENFLRVLARGNDEAYWALLFNLSSYLPAETEEELYRLRSARLAEYGFSPFEEALAVYAPLEPSALKVEAKPLLPGALALDEEKDLIPVASFFNIEDFGFLKETLGRLTDPPETDRIRLEFATLCNTLIAAGSYACLDDDEGLGHIGRQAAGYLHLALTALCGQDMDHAAKVLCHHSLMTIFRVGYGYAAKLQWRAKRWVAESWFSKAGRRLDFWGSPWSDVLEGLLLTRPLCFDPDAPGTYRPFESYDDVRKTEERLVQAQALDRMLARLTHIASGPAAIESATFAPLLFARWARHLLCLEPSFTPLSRAQAAAFFRLLRQGETGPPYRMERHRSAFIGEFCKGAAGFEAAAADALSRALSDLWTMFAREYENVATKDLSCRYAKYLPIRPGRSEEDVHAGARARPDQPPEKTKQVV